MNKNSALHLPTDSDQFFVLDIDSTLVSTHQRNQAILFEFAHTYSKKFPEDSVSLLQAQCRQGDYGYLASLARIGFQPQHPETMTSLRTFWEKKFFSNDYLHHDMPFAGAVEWVHQLKQKGLKYIFLTARHKKTMWEGTLTTMASMGFPISAEILFLKEDLAESDELYKTKLMARLRHSLNHQEIWFLDNEPVVLHSIRKDHPDIRLAWFDSCHSGKMQPPPEAAVIRTFS